MAGRTDDVIRSRANPFLQRLRALKEKGARGEQGLMLLEGLRLVEEALRAGVELVEVAAAPRGIDATVLDGLRARGVRVRRVEERLLGALSELDTGPGFLAVARRPAFSEDALYRGRPLVLIVAGVQNPGNLGGLLRTAEAAGVTGAYLTRGTADALSWKALRGSMGSAFRIPHVAGVSAAEAIRRARSRGLQVVAAAPREAASYDRIDWRGPTALVLGAEGAGLPAELVDLADARASVPMAPAVESLNVGVAAAVMLFEAARQRRG
jgi:TrmH family RNA methyltransferase